MVEPDTTEFSAPETGDLVLSVKEYGLSIQKRMRKDNKDFTAAVTGEKGVGKSTFIIELIRSMCLSMLIPFSLEKNVVFTGTTQQVINEAKRKVLNLQHYDGISIDEAIKATSKSKWQDSIVKGLSDFMQTTRKEHKAVFFALPHLSSLTKMTRETVLDVWIHIPVPGIALVFRKCEFEYKDMWGLDSRLKSYRNKTRFKRLSTFRASDYLAVYKNCQNFVATVLFNKMPEDLEKEYLRIDRERKKQTLVLELQEQDNKVKFFKRIAAYSLAFNEFQLGQPPEGGVSRFLAQKLTEMMPEGQSVSHPTVFRLLKEVKTERSDEPKEETADLLNEKH